MPDTKSPQYAFLIDMDGLLLDTERVALQSWKLAEKDTGLTVPAAFYFSIIGQSMQLVRERLVEWIEQPADRERFLVAANLHYKTLLEQDIPVKKGAAEWLRYLAANNIPRCLATSTYRTLAESKLQRAGLAQWLPLRVCGDEVSHSKPSPEIYLTAAALLGLPPALCHAVEDSENGIRSASAAGCSVIHVPDIANVSPQTLSLVSQSFPDLIELLDSIQ